MKQTRTSDRLISAIVGGALAIALCGCGQSKADKEAADVAAVRALLEKQAADKKAADEKAEAENKARFAEMKAQAASSAKTLGYSK